MPVVELTGVSKAYKGRTLFRDVNLCFEEGRVYGFEGPNGAGKSVLLKIICKFVRPDVGSVKIDPLFCERKSGFPTSFGVIIDRPGYISSRSGFDNLKSLASIRGKITDQDIVSAMERVGLDPRAEQKVRHYSLGMKQKLALAQAFMEDQPVLVLDEPFNALDVGSVESVRALLIELHREGKTVIFTSHNRQDMALLCDEVYRIDGARLERTPLPESTAQ